MKGVLVQVVDNYQGEENDIILLSLVRSNRRNEIGFLKTENRVCVALTRAKLGMYIIGNMTCLSSSAIWMKMKCTLERQRALGTGLPLRCRLHTTKISIVATSSDFQTKSPFGGCTLQCGYPLPCSHICTRTCHPNNQDHSNYKCRNPCENICPYNHPCQKFCFEICGDCTVQVPKVRSCSHEYVLECGVDEERIRCMKPCPKKLPCLHPCTKKCFENCAICTRLVQKERSCGHFYPLMCSDDPEYVKCLMPCSRNLRCNHKCQRKCWEECMPCEENVEKTRSCGHTYKLKCFENPEQIKCLQPCTLTLKCSHKCQHKCWEKCEPCEVPVKKTLRCAHNQQVKCFEDPEQVKCLMPCTRTLKCNHPCQRQCWEKCKPCEVTVTGTRSCGHIYTKYCSTDLEKLFCSEKCAKTLICDHKCARLCSENCDPCEVLETRKRTCGHVVYNVSCCTSQESLEQRLCRKICSKNLNCGHSCMKECWEECPPCMKPVLKKATCGHELKVSCFIEIPQRKFCFNPCQVELSCGHQCANTCNKPCTEVCKVEVQGRRACSHVALFECWELEKGINARMFVACCVLHAETIFARAHTNRPALGLAQIMLPV
ncbi:hypothetical protein B566_EDAN011900 [Ephemera danica]|nr:hypothetical protein B566_EDAN011900 [Ephemera danica]